MGLPAALPAAGLSAGSEAPPAPGSGFLPSLQAMVQIPNKSKSKILMEMRNFGKNRRKP